MPETLNEALERSAQPREARNLLDRLNLQTTEVARVIGDEVGAARFVRTFLTELRRVPKLYECSEESLLGALMLSAQLGLEPGPLGHVYYVPMGGQVTFIVGYKGIVDLAYRSGLLKRIETGIVREGDTFEFRKGTHARLDHVEAGPPGEREWTHVYAVAELKTGGKPFEVLYPEQVEARRKRSASAKANAGPWTTDTEAMWRKSAIRALSSVLPQSPLPTQALRWDEAPIEALADVVTPDDDGRE